MGLFREASLAMWQVAEEYDVPFVPSWESLERIPRERQEWLWAMHPGSLIYREIAQDVADTILDRDAGHTERATREEFRNRFREQTALLLRAAKQVALAVPPFTDQERKVFDGLQEFAQTQFAPEALQPITAVEVGTAITEANSRANVVSVLEQLSRADGQMDPEELAYIEAIPAEMQHNITGKDTK